MKKDQISRRDFVKGAAASAAVFSIVPSHVLGGTGGTLYIGDEGKMLGNTIIPEAKSREYKSPEKSIPRSPGHHQEWINACKGGKSAGSNFDWAGPLAEAVLLGNIALRRALKEKVNRLKLHWDPKAFKIANLPEANQYLHREYRKGWSL